MYVCIYVCWHVCMQIDKQTETHRLTTIKVCSQTSLALLFPPMAVNALINALEQRSIFTDLTCICYVMHNKTNNTINNNKKNKKKKNRWFACSHFLSDRNKYYCCIIMYDNMGHYYLHNYLITCSINKYPQVNK